MARKLLILFMALSWCVPCVSIDFKIPYKTPQDCQPTQYFQFSSLRCQNCETPGQKRSEDKLSCVCETGYKLVVDKDGIQKDKGGPPVADACKNCDETGSLNMTSSSDGIFCVNCPKDVGFNTNLGKCNDCPDNHFPTDRGFNGEQLQTRQCIRCVGKTRTGANNMQTCRRCHWSFLKVNNTFCSPCNEDEGNFVVVGGVCFKQTELISDVPNLYKVKYGDKDITSKFFEDNLRAAQELCEEYSNFTACQLLGNLCVLLEYTERGNDACKQYKDLVTSKIPDGVVNDVNRDWPVVMPWLFYQSSASTAAEALDKTDIAKLFQSNEDMTFVFAVFTLNGSFVGYETGLDVLHLCQDRPAKKAAASKFATTYKSSCSVAVKELTIKPNLFYDMYLLLPDNKLYPVPLLVENYLDGGEKVNEGTNRGRWKLTRRFYVVENIVGKTANDEWIRYAEKIELSIRMRSTDGEIFPSMLRIRYKALNVKDETVLNGNQDASFVVTYEMETSKVKKDTEV